MINTGVNQICLRQVFHDTAQSKLQADKSLGTYMLIRYDNTVSMVMCMFNDTVDIL